MSVRTSTWSGCVPASMRAQGPQARQGFSPSPVQCSAMESAMASVFLPQPASPWIKKAWTTEPDWKERFSSASTPGCP